MDEVDPLLLEIDRLISLSRLKEIAFIMDMERSERILKIASALKRLGFGEYLLGTGPSTAGIIQLNKNELILGRPATVFERRTYEHIDKIASDNLYFSPREISRKHAKIIRRANGSVTKHVIIDLRSTCGTYVNNVKVQPGSNGQLLIHGDVISLGPSQTNTYVYYKSRNTSIQSRPKPYKSKRTWVWVGQ